MVEVQQQAPTADFASVKEELIAIAEEHFKSAPDTYENVIKEENYEAWQVWNKDQACTVIKCQDADITEEML